MKIYKIGHSCFVIEEGGTKVLTDPGQFSSENLEREEMVKLRDLNAVFITHVHPDHLNVDLLKVVMENNPGVDVFGNQEVADLLAKEGTEIKLVKDKEEFSVGEFSVQAFETDHGFIHESVPTVRNTGYLFNGIVYHPGDALNVPPGEIELLGVPIGAPWATIGQLLDYALEVKPEKAMPTHDGLLSGLGPFQFLMSKVLGEAGIEFIPLRPGEEYEI